MQIDIATVYYFHLSSILFVVFDYLLIADIHWKHDCSVSLLAGSLLGGVLGLILFEIEHARDRPLLFSCYVVPAAIACCLVQVFYRADQRRFMVVLFDSG